MLAVMLGIVAANAQGTGTVVVANGTATNQYVPIYGYYVDNFLRCQTIYPESMLTEIAGMEIQGITYYLTSPAAGSWGVASFEVKIGTVTDESFSSTAWADVSSFTTVYTGALDGTQSELTINFTTPYTYTGGNLLIEVNNTVKGTYKSCTFAGTAATNASLSSNSSTSLEAMTTGTYRNFIPKTGFIVPVSCGTPTLGTITPAAYTTTVAWTENGSATAWQLKLDDGEWFDVTENPYTITGLTPETDYDLQLRSNCGGDGMSFVASSSFTTTPSCPAPTGLTATPAETSIVLAWTEAGSATEWQIKVGDEDWMDVTENPYTLDHLTANTAYAIQVRANCGGGDVSQAASVSTRTLCTTQATPYEEDFTSHTSGSAPNCWTTVVANGTYPKIGNTASYATDGNYLEMYGNYSGGYVCLVTSPELDRDANTLNLTFDAWLSNYASDTLYVGVIDDLNDAATFTSVFSLVGNQNGGSWTNYEINLSAVAAIASSTSKYIAFRFYGSGDYCRLDNIVIAEPPACSKPIDLTLEESTGNSLTLSWTETGSASTWVLKVNDGSWTEVRDNPYELTGLTANTEYAISVRAFCDPDTSDAVSATFRTPCATILSGDLPYFEGFEGSDFGCWNQEIISGTNSWTQGASAGSYSTSITPIEGSKLALAKSSTRGNQMRLISPVFDVEGVNNLTLTFAHTQLAWGSDQDSLVIEYRLNNSSAWQRLAGYTENISSWEVETITLPATSSTLQIAFHAYLDYGYGVAVDSVTLKTVSCANPEIVDVTPMETSATVSWTGSAAQYGVRLGDGEEEVIDNTTKEFTGLTANTEYTVYVRSICGVGDSSEIVSQTFRTPCAAEVVTTDDSYVEEFEEITSGIPSCWEQTASDWESYATGYAGRGLYFTEYYGGVDTLITPEFNLSALTNGAQLRFWYKLPEEEDWYGNAYSATLEVLYRTSTSGEWTVGETLTDVVEDWTEYEYILPASTAAASYQIAFRAVSASSYTDTYVYLDNVIVETVPSCQRPTSGTITGVTPESAVVTWDAVAGATGYSVAYGETNDVDAATVVSADDATKTLEGLYPETDYYVWVRTVCGSDNANWLALGMFTTEVACAEVTGLSVTEATTSSITIGWTIDGSIGYESTSVLVGYKEASASDWTVTTPTGNSFTLDNLGEGETYNFVVQNICGNDSANFVDLTASTKVCGEVGDGSTVSNYIPSNVYYNYSYSQAIYTAAEVGDIDTIHGISYNYNGTSNPTRTVTVYIADVENAVLEDAFMTIDNFTEVATNYNWTMANGWSEIVFDEPFVHESGKDIVIAIDDNTGSYVSSNPRTFAAHAGSGFRYYNDDTNPDPTNITVAGTAETSVADIRFTAACPTAQPGTCDVPTGLAANNVTENSAVISWTGNAAQYEVELNGQSSTVNTNSYTAQGLTAATAYTVRVRALCDGGLTSDWTAVVNFTTLDEPQPMECNTPTGLAASNVTANSANISWNEVTIAETFDGEWNLAMGAEDSVHTMITPDATMHTLLNYLGMDFEDVDENVSVAGTLVPVTIEPAAGNQMNVTGSFDMAMYGVDDPVTFHFSTTGTVTSTGMNIEPATINETVRIMNAMDIDYTGTVTFAQPTALPVDGTLTIGIASMNISGYGDTTVNVGIAMTGSVSISMVGTNLTASGSRETTNAYPTYELVVTNVATGVETPITNATTPYALEGLTASTEYTVKVRTHCDENSTSDWSAAVSFTTLNGGGEDPTCDVPTNIVIDQESINTPYAALITWNGTASQYEIEITGGEQPVTTTVSTNSYTFNGVASTTYSVRVRAICDGGVTSDWSAAQSFTTPNGGEPQGIDDVNASYSVNIYPNPAKNTVTISVDGLSGKAQVSVIDMSGRTVMTSTMESDATQLNVSKLAQGTYFVRINGETISTVRKLVVK